MTDQRAMLAAIRRAAVDVTGGDLSGKCAAVALIVQAACGGELIEGWVALDNYTGCHYWNRLPDGSEVDLTSCQFGGDGRTPIAAGEPVARPDLIDPLHLSLGAAMYARLKRKAEARKLPKRRFTDAPQATRCKRTITLRDGSKAQCGRAATKDGLCTQHRKLTKEPDDA